MYVSDRKARFLSERIARWLSDHAGVEILDGVDQVVLAIQGVLASEVREEEALDNEVETILRANASSIGDNMDLSLLRRKIKNELAKKKGIVL